MIRKFIAPLTAIAALGLAFSFNGCSCQAEMNTDAKTPEPAPEPPPPPAPEPAPAPPEDTGEVKQLHAVGDATIKGDRVEIPGDLEFDFNKTTIKESETSKKILNTLVEFMKANPNVDKMRIEGHTDDKGSHEYNQKLSEGRAASVVKWLAEHGVDKNRLVAVGLGETRPDFPNDTEEHRAKNRRTEFHVQQMDGKPMGSAPAAGGADGGAAPGAATKADAATPKKN